MGVGSVGTFAFIVLLQGRDSGDPLFLQIKEATDSVLENHLAKSAYQHAGQRVVHGQRVMQAARCTCVQWQVVSDAAGGVAEPLTGLMMLILDVIPRWRISAMSANRRRVKTYSVDAFRRL